VLRARAARIPNSQIGLAADLRCVLHQGPLWAVSDIRHKGRRAGVRCKCELKFELQREPTFNLSQIYGSCCDAEGSCEPIATDAAIYTNLTGARKSNIGREGFLSRQSVSTD
jgi:hypothetical protein